MARYTVPVAVAPTHRPAWLMLSSSYWAGPLKFRRHQFARLAAEAGTEVVYVNPTFTLLSFVREPNCRGIFFDFLRGPREVAPGLHVVTLPPLVPFQRRFLAISVLNSRIARVLLEHVLRRHFPDREFVQFVYLPEDYFRVTPEAGRLVVYDCIDEHAAYPWNQHLRDEIAALEKRLLQRADLVTVTSTHLLERKRTAARPPYLVPNGVDLALFARALAEETPLARDVADLEGPVLLYVGAIAEWFDTVLLDHIATSHPDWTIVLIGPRSIRAPVFERTNVLSLGARAQADIPGYLKRANVCLIPFVVDELTRAVNPLKLYEYLAAGKPVVSTALPDVYALEAPGVVHVARTHDEFVRQVEACLARREGDVPKRLDAARPFSWTNIFRRLADAVEQRRGHRSN